MKTQILLSILILGIIVSAFSQKPSMTLTFTADNNGQHVPLNSVLIENLTQGVDTTLYAPDTVLVLDYITGMEEVSDFNDNGFSLLQNYPNPIKNHTTIDLYLHEKANIVISVSDIVGRESFNNELQLEHGKHSFTFYPGSENLYFLTVVVGQQSQTIKMLNSQDYAIGSGSFKLEYNGNKNEFIDMKSESGLNNFAFELGDLLKYTSFTDLGQRIILSSPTGDQTYYFEYSGETCAGTPTVTDIDGNVYNTVAIGDQCWMKENLKTTTYQDGTPIPNVTDAGEWALLTTSAYAWYENDIDNKDSYGALYNWFAAVDDKELCPAGWHMPTKDEWEQLTDYTGVAYDTIGIKLKSCRTVNSPLGGGCNTTEHPRWDEDLSTTPQWGTDDHGFSGLPGGRRSFDDGFFLYIGQEGTWWSSTDGVALQEAIRFSMVHLNGQAGTNQEKYVSGLSVRCIKD